MDTATATVSPAAEALPPFEHVEPAANPHWLWMVTAVPGPGNPLSIAIVVLYTLVMGLIGLWRLPQQVQGLGLFIAACTQLGVLALLIVPQLLLLRGAWHLFFPARRGAALEAEHSLTEVPAGIPQLDEIRAFVQQHGRDVELRVNLLRLNELAFIYPCGPRRARLAVFGGLVRLWAADRPAAEAVLLHELAHYVRGDYLHLGVGAQFERAVRVGALLSLGLLVFTALLVRTSASFLLLQYFSIGLVQTIVTLVLAVWSCELTADHLAASHGAGGGLRRALVLMRERGTVLQRLLARFSHPPQGLRHWALRLSPEGRLLLLNVLFPLGCMLRDFALLAVFVLWTVALDMSPGKANGVFTEEMLSWLTMGTFTIYFIGLFILPLWPRLYRRIARTFVTAPLTVQPWRAASYWKAVGVLTVAWIPVFVINISLQEVLSKRLVKPLWMQIDFGALPDFSTLPPIDYDSLTLPEDGAPAASGTFDSSEFNWEPVDAGEAAPATDALDSAATDYYDYSGE